MEFLRLDIDINDTGMKQAQVTCQAAITREKKTDEFTRVHPCL
jgi:hypothetical protein